jgi:hypothetical protein
MLMTSRIRRDQDRLKLHALLLEGARSKPVGEADAAYFEALRRSPRTEAARGSTPKPRR